LGNVISEFPEPYLHSDSSGRSVLHRSEKFRKVSRTRDPVFGFLTVLWICICIRWQSRQAAKDLSHVADWLFLSSVQRQGHMGALVSNFSTYDNLITTHGLHFGSFSYTIRRQISGNNGTGTGESLPWVDAPEAEGTQAIVSTILPVLPFFWASVRPTPI